MVENAADSKLEHGSKSHATSEHGHGHDHDHGVLVLGQPHHAAHAAGAHHDESGDGRVDTSIIKADMACSAVDLAIGGSGTAGGEAPGREAAGVQGFGSGRSDLDVDEDNKASSSAGASECGIEPGVDDDGGAADDLLGSQDSEEVEDIDGSSTCSSASSSLDLPHNVSWQEYCRCVGSEVLYGSARTGGVPMG